MLASINVIKKVQIAQTGHVYLIESKWKLSSFSSYPELWKLEVWRNEDRNAVSFRRHS